jgi:predicted NAD-dependent protein-ADP-ribosyltransferase YbiA (DUF1768 family)
MCCELARTVAEQYFQADRFEIELDENLRKNADVADSEPECAQISTIVLCKTGMFHIL